MKPRNEREREAFRLYGRLPKYSETQMRWIERKVVATRIYTSGKKCWCSKCGGEWSEKIEGERATCPHCNTESEVKRGRHTTDRGFYYARFFQTFHGWQVIRYALVRWWCRKGQAQSFDVMDVIQKWCQPGRPMITFGAALTMCPYYRQIPYSLWSTQLTIKYDSAYHTEWMECKTYPRKSFLPLYVKVLGRNPDFKKYSAPALLGHIMGNAYLERLYKEGRDEQLKRLLYYTDELAKYWPSVKIALRHGYEPTDWASYFDHLKALRFLRYDMHSPRYVAPPDFGELHDLVMRQYRNKLEALQYKRQEAYMLRLAIEREEAERRRAEEAKECAATFAERIARFAELQIEDADIVIVPLMSIDAFKEEGDAMHHCVFSNSYWKHTDSLILSARTKEGNERVETIEVSLRDGRIVQSQGKYNNPTEKHEEICALVKNAIPRILSMAI